MLQKSQTAKEENEESSAKETIQVEVLGSFGKRGKIDLEKLNTNLKKISGLKYNNSELSDTNIIDELPVVVKLDGYMFKINDDGDVIYEL